MSMDKWATSKSTQFSTKVWVKLLLLLGNTLELNFEALYLINSPLGYSHNSTPFHRPWTEAHYTKWVGHENGWGLECQEVNFLEYLGQGTLGCLH